MLLPEPRSLKIPAAMASRTSCLAAPSFSRKYYRKLHSFVWDDHSLYSTVCCEWVTHLHVWFVAVLKYSHGSQGARAFRKDKLDQYSDIIHTSAQLRIWPYV